MAELKHATAVTKPPPLKHAVALTKPQDAALPEHPPPPFTQAIALTKPLSLQH
jgi:hypothetical protein